jgi:hypothetical protein
MRLLATFFAAALMLFIIGNALARAEAVTAPAVVENGHARLSGSRLA